MITLLIKDKYYLIHENDAQDLVDALHERGYLSSKAKIGIDALKNSVKNRG